MKKFIYNILFLYYNIFDGRIKRIYNDLPYRLKGYAYKSLKVSLIIGYVVGRVY